MFFSFFWRNIFFNFITKKYNTYFIIIVDRTESEYRPNFCDQIFFILMNRSKHRTGTYIYQKDHGKFALFFKNFRKWMRISCTYIPINKSYIIAVIIFTHFSKSHAFSLKCRMIFTGKKMCGDLLTDDLQFFYFFVIKLLLKYEFVLFLCLLIYISEIIKSEIRNT